MNTKSYQKIVGVDIAKRKFDTYESDCRTRRVISYTKEAVEKFVATLEEFDGDVLVVMEATGGYENALADALFDAQIDCVIANPRQVRDFCRGIGRIEKNDSIDAEALAQFGEVVKPKVAEKTSDDERKLKELVHRREQVIQQVTREKNRMEQARSSEAQRSIKKAIDFYTRERKQLDKQIDKATQQCEGLKEKAAILRSCKGVGNVTTAVLLVELPELGTLNRGQVAKLVGVAPIANDSGTKSGRRSIYGGRHRIRRAIYMATLVAMRWNDPIKRFYLHLIAKGKPTKVAMVACMRKLLTTLNVMVKNQQKWGENTLAT